MIKKRNNHTTFYINLDVIHKKVTHETYWFDNVPKETVNTKYFDNNQNDYIYCADNTNMNVNEKINRQSLKVFANVAEYKKINYRNEYLYKIKDTNINVLDTENCIKTIKCSNEIDKNDNINENEASFVKTSSREITRCIQHISVNDCYSISLQKNELISNKQSSNNKETGRSVDVNNQKIFKQGLCEFKNIADSKKHKKVFVNKGSSIILEDFEQSRRITRLLVKRNISIPVKPLDCSPGKLVWGNFRNGWWPAIIIQAKDAGMLSTTGKIWVSWIGTSQISEMSGKIKIKIYLKNVGDTPMKCIFHSHQLHTRYVDSFSNKLELRLSRLATNSKIKLTSKKEKDNACLKTIQLLKNHFECKALVRPYVSWIKHNILPQKNKLDEILFYPYPDTLSEKLNNLKKKNFHKNEKYLRQKEKKDLNKIIQTKTSNKRIEKLEKPIEEGGINIIDQKSGMIIWAKLQGYSLWPCVIMSYHDLNRKQPRVAHQWVMWYGDYKYSQIEYRQILNFSIGMEKMETKIKTTKDDIFSKAVLQASKDYCQRLGYVTESWKLGDVIKFFFKSKHTFKSKNIILRESNDHIYSPTIKNQLIKQINNEPVSEERKQQILKSKNIKLVLSKKIPLDSLCVTCFKSDKKLEEHPFFYASMCKICLEEFRPKIFAYGNDYKCFYCTLCGGEDIVAMCDNINCPRVFCTACIKYIICPPYYEEVLLKHPWLCFLCDSNSIVMNHSVLRIRNDWRKNIISIFHSNYDKKTATNLERIHRNKKIRVLSLFDGIGTGLLVLKKLNINVECYYASEIDPDSMQVTFFNHGHTVIQIGDVRNIDEKKIKEIVPIDLLIGGSPCNDLSLANPKRRGLDDPEGTGILFYEYCRIKQLLNKYNKKRQLFWLFENVASMPKKFRAKISENLGCDPIFIDSANFSAQHRPRLYWGNIPWTTYEINDVVLQDVLRKHCNRQALVKKIMTVTTKTNSLNQNTSS